MLDLNFLDYLHEESDLFSDKKYHLLNDSFFIVRNLPNNDQIFFFEISDPIDLNLIVPNFLTNLDLDKKYIKPNYDNRYGEIDVSGWQNLIKTKDYEIILSKQYSFKEHYDASSLVYEMISEDKLIISEIDNKLSITNSSYDGKSSFSIFVTKKYFFNSDENLNQYLDLFYSELFKCNAACSTWYKHDALLTKTAASVKPYNKKSYQISIHHSSKKELVHLYRVKQDRFIYNLLVNAVFTILNFQPSYEGMYLTTFTSNWLYQKYGIESPYIDTRLNETFVNAFRDIKELTHTFQDVDISRNYQKFLEKNITNIHQSKNGFFFPDYFTLKRDVLTHTSLNHQLGIANYLLKIYEEDKSNKILDIYNAIINFIVDTKDSWINNESGDLFYEANTDKNGSLKFSGNDYIYVTLSDLLFLLKNHLKIFKVMIPEFVFLINKKIEFLVKNGFDPEFSNSIASGEGENDKKHCLRLIKEMNLYYLLDLARKETSFYLDKIHNLSDLDLMKEIPSAWLIYLKSKQAFEIGDKSKADFFYRLNHVLHSSSIPYTAKIGKNSLFAYGGIGVIIHKDCNIGERCNIGSGVTIGGNHQGVPNIGHDVFISTGAKILGAVIIGDGAIIGANAVVNKDVLPFTVVGGIPAVPINNITRSNFKKYSGFYWCKNDLEKSKIFCDYYMKRKKMIEGK